jgi:uncharacterized RDD family membrane protein YckC
VLYGVPVCKKCFYSFANRRQCAYIIDSVVWQVSIFVPLGFIVGFLAASTPAGQTNTSLDQFELLIDILPYPLFLIFAMKDGFRGRSLGKSICGVTVLDQDTYQPIGFLPSLKRNLVLIIPIVPLIIAFLLQKGYRWGDNWANSKVVWTKYQTHPLFTGQLACTQCQYDLRGCTSGACPECGCPIPEQTHQAILEAGPPSLDSSARPPMW